MRRHDVVINDRGKMHSDIILGHADLLWHLAQLNLDIDLNKFLRHGIDLDKAGIDGAIEAAEFCHEPDIALRDWLEGVRTAEAARDCAEETNQRAEPVHELAVNAIAGVVVSNSEVLGVRGLEFAVADGLDGNKWCFGGGGGGGEVAVGGAEGRGRGGFDGVCHCGLVHW